MPRRLAPAVLLSFLILPLSIAPGRAADGAPDHLAWARRLVAGVTPETNLYASRPTVVTWSGVNGATETRNRSVCSALVAHLFRQAYGYRAADFASWLGGRFPRAAGFHDAIVAGHGFDPVRPDRGHPAGRRAGDQISAGEPSDRPCAARRLAARAAARHGAGRPGHRAVRAEVIDSSHTGHGPTDTRHYAKGKFHSGVGEGLFRLYAGPDGTLAGYSWSVTKASEVYAPERARPRDRAPESPGQADRPPRPCRRRAGR